jgi:membrane protein YdbS with pleckstrin-like domain
METKYLEVFEGIRDKDEEILWIEKPVFTPFVLNGFGAILPAIIGAVLIFTFFLTDSKEGEKTNWIILVFGLIAIGQGLYTILNKILSYQNTFYAYSNRRVIMRTGFWGIDYKIIDYDKISDIEVRVNVIEKIFNVGTVQFFSGRTQKSEDDIKKLYDRWEAIRNPYDVFKMVKQISVDIKTDYNYPNALRPDSNPGYNTKYKK